MPNTALKSSGVWSDQVKRVIFLVKTKHWRSFILDFYYCVDNIEEKVKHGDWYFITWRNENGDSFSEKDMKRS